MLLALAAAATLAAPANVIDPAKLVRRDMVVVDEPPAHCTQRPQRIAEEASKGRVLEPVWTPSQYLDAGYYAPVNKTVDGCPVPAVISLPNRERLAR